MGKRVGIKEAAELVGLSEWELRQGINTGKYPAMKVGVGKGKYILDIDLLEERIQELMKSNIRENCDHMSELNYGRMRRVG